MHHFFQLVHIKEKCQLLLLAIRKIPQKNHFIEGIGDEEPKTNQKLVEMNLFQPASMKELVSTA